MLHLPSHLVAVHHVGQRERGKPRAHRVLRQKPATQQRAEDRHVVLGLLRRQHGGHDAQAHLGIAKHRALIRGAKKKEKKRKRKKKEGKKRTLPTLLSRLVSPHRLKDTQTHLCTPGSRTAPGSSRGPRSGPAEGGDPPGTSPAAAQARHAANWGPTTSTEPPYQQTTAI